jgi:NADPH-dependent 2,4-dienoyl-CoA reductase/sulfur reductase-like enzyme/peroxiredoxin family protein/rhodanese-related sulfurtransferase/TusA-related sulfurtransferase
MKILIIGGVAAGMSAAARARRLDESAEIVVLERSKHVSFANCGLPYHVGGVIKERDHLLLQTPQSLKASLNLDVRVGHEARGIDRQRRTVQVMELESGREYDESYDKLVLAPGAVPIRPNLVGINHSQVYVLRNIEDMDLIKGKVDGGARKAVVIGGGYIGVEMAENLRERGLEVDLVEMADQIIPPLDREMARDLEVHMADHGVKLHLGLAAAVFREAAGKVEVELTNATVLSADLAILAAGVRPDTALARAAGLTLGARGGIQVDPHMRTSDPDIFAAGDAVEVVDTVTGQPSLIPLAGPANRQGRIAGENICGRNTRYSTTQGTAIVKIFDMTGGGTGASEKTLKKAGRAYLKLYLHPSGHAGYYPGSAPMHIKVLFEPETGKLLGAQVVGYDGVDKRLDVFATAIRAGMTVDQLEHLELAYAPPYSSAKDPVNMAGFIGHNLLMGDVEFWYAEEFPKKTTDGLIIDVRSAQEYELWHIPGAVNVPLGTLRSQINKIPKDRKVYLYCRVGFRSYLAYRLLRQRGITKLATLAGGSLTFCSVHEESVCKDPASHSKPQPLLSYAEEPKVPAVTAPGKTVDLDCCGLQCPGPIRRMKEEMDKLAPGDQLKICVTDPGFLHDAPAWCLRNGQELLNVRREGGRIEALVRKCEAPGSRPGTVGVPKDRKTFVIFSNDLDKVLAGFVIANGALAMGSEVSMFFTFWGINALRKPGPQAAGKGLLDKMFGWMMPKGPGALTLSKMHMMGMGTAMMKMVMKQKNVDSLPALIASARAGGAKLVVCTMSMDVMGIKPGELVDGLEYGGVGAFLGEADQSNMTLFI